MAIHGRNRDKITDAIGSQIDFTVASMSGTRIGARYPVQAGQLNEHREIAEELQLGIARGDVTYVVYSYATPIGWIANGKGHVPAINYSVTASHHQNITRVAFAMRGIL
jgi:hypothetical protein